MPTSKHLHASERVKPTAAPADPSCTAVISNILSDQTGIVGVDLNPNHHTVSLEYDSAQLSEQQITKIAKCISDTIKEQFAACAMPLQEHDTRFYEICPAQLGKNVGRFKEARTFTVGFHGGVMNLAHNHDIPSTTLFIQQVSELDQDIRHSTLEPPAASTVPAQDTRSKTLLRAWTSTERLEIAFTAITFVSMICAWLLTKFTAHQHLAPTLLYALDYTTGSIYGVRKGMQSLLQLKIDVDLLMIMAAADAAVVGATVDLPLPLSVVGHEGGTVLVSLNGLRMLALKRKFGRLV